LTSNDDVLNFQFMAEHSADIICRVGLDAILRYVSPSSFRVLGWTPQELVGTGPQHLVIAEDMPLIAASEMRNRAQDSVSPPVTLRMRRKNGSVVWMEVSTRLVREPLSGDPIETILVMRDISERKALEEKLSALSFTDALTGLSNRRAFDEDLEREWLRTLRDGSHMSLLLLDVDLFKEFNDLYGHQVGDDCLRAIAAAIRYTVRATDLASRYGGEEIAIILPSSDTPGAVETAEKVRVAVEGLKIPHARNPHGGGWITASIGVATAIARDGSRVRMPEGLLLAADVALYKAKHAGRNRIATALIVVSKVAS
jgi:diguanylate cyclase (GGDEF)-like protein/PAS domain S-box-containing protein